MLIKIQTYIVKLKKETLSHSYTQMVTCINSGAYFKHVTFGINS
jgi:hypothetical protein